MLFGLTNKFLAITAVALVSLQTACNNKVANYITFKQPLQGEYFSSGQNINVALDFPEDAKIKSVLYFVDGEKFAERNDTTSVLLETAKLKLGFREITAVVDNDGVADTLVSNIVIKSNIQPKSISYSVVYTFPHDTSSYTQGLSYVNGKFLESTGRNGFSKVKWVDPTSGKELKSTALDAKYFGEGSVLIEDKIAVLTWRENIGLVFDANSLTQVSTFPYQNSREGWGLTYDGAHILKSDGTNKIWKLDPKTFKELSYFEVYDNLGAVENLNELEFIDGKLYANVYGSTKFVIIDPTTGAVEAQVDLADLVPKNYFTDEEEVANNVLNGIAYDKVGKRLFVTGKKWPKLYEIKLRP